MKHTKTVLPWLTGLIFILVFNISSAGQTATDPLPAWNSGTTKQRIIDCVTKVTDSESSAFVPVNKRIATFDNDGTLWSEKPTYFQLLFIIDRVKSMAADHPEWKTTQPFKAVLDNDMAALKAAGMHGLLELTMATHAGMTTEAFELIDMAQDWQEIYPAVNDQ